VNWSEGYVTDVGYTRGYYRELAASWQSFLLAATGHEPPDLSVPFTKVELGCGYGLSLLTEAAAFPHAQFFGVDFNPDHITWAKRIAAQAQIDNVHFLEMSFADLQGSPIPDAEFICMHGVWTWVSEDNRQAIKRFLDRRLKSGGVALISYNTLPGWSAKSGLRELMLGKYRSTAGPTEERIKESLAFAQACRDAGAPMFPQNPGLSEHLEKLLTLPTRYLAHEYFNQDWNLFYHHQVADALAEVRLSYLASGKPVENYDKLNYQQGALALFDKVAPKERETLRDIHINRTFRYDLYGRGIEKIGLLGAADHILNSNFAMVDQRSKFQNGVLKTPAGQIKLKPELHEPILNRLEKSLTQAKNLVMQPGSRPLTVADVTEMLAILMDAGVVFPALPEDGFESRLKRAQRLNQVLLERSRKGEDISFFVSPVSGYGHAVKDIHQFFMQAEHAGAEPINFAWSELKTRGRRMMKEGKLIDSKEDNLKELESQLLEFTKAEKVILKNLKIFA